MVTTARQLRHVRWIRLREHVYICSSCGTGRINVPTGNGWRVRWCLPDGTISMSPFTPPCLPGRRTGAHLEKYAALIAAGGVPKTPKSEPFDIEGESLVGTVDDGSERQPGQEG